MTITTHVVKRSANSKLGPIAATYRTQPSCPTSCPLLNNGCYASGRIFNIPKKFGTEDLGKVLDLINTLPEDGMVRLNVSGDFLDVEGNLDRAYVDACNELAVRRVDVKIIAYTHAWREVSPTDFHFSVNASCETAADVEQALAAGWQTVMVAENMEDPLIGSTIGGRRVALCPAQTRGVTCADCGACAADTPTRPIIAFAIHGATRAKARKTLAKARA